ncbi:MAG: hypothetical protein IPK69_10155 [Phycisphaerales bacterium]|nr:MAG: hypothetical protein IPK69_10155 [Phycisphaerales bacterium]
MRNWAMGMGLAVFAGLAGAQPATFTDLGAHTGNESLTVDVVLPAPNAVEWYRIELPAAQDALATYMDMWTVSGGDNPMTDTEVGVYDSVGNLVASDDDDSDGLFTALSFGQMNPTRPAVGTGVVFNGRDGQIDAGVYWIAVGRFNVTFNTTNWDATSTYTGTQTTTTLNMNIQGVRPLAGSATVTPSPVAPGGQIRFELTASPADNPTSTGIAGTINLTEVGGSASQALFDNGTNGDTTAGDNIFTYTYTIPGGTTSGVKNVPWTLTDAQSRTASGNRAFAVSGPGLYFDTEPNDTKDAATIINGFGPGNTIIGLTTGATTNGDDGSQDTYRIKTPAAASGIYKYTVTLSSDTPGHTATLRGLTQTGGVINAGTDTTFQTAFTDVDTTRKNVWYGFGREEEMYYRVAGTASTTGSYTVTINRESVTREGLLTNPSNAGQLTVRVTGGDPEIWVMNGDTLVTLDGYNNDDTIGGGLVSTLTRDFQAGRYTLVLSDYNLGCDLPSPVDEAGPVDPVVDFPNSMVSSDRETTGPTFTVEVFEGDVNGTLVTTETFVQTGDFGMVFVDMIVGGGSTCVADVDDGSGTGTSDGAVTIDDLLYYITIFQTGAIAADVDNGTGTGTQDGAVTIDDLLYFIQRFQAGC